MGLEKLVPKHIEDGKKITKDKYKNKYKDIDKKSTKITDLIKRIELLESMLGL